MKTCNLCNKTYPLTKEFFWTNGKQPSDAIKWKPSCKDCSNSSRKVRAFDIIKEVFETLECAVCGYDNCKEAIDFHHLDPNEKDFDISKAYASSFNKERLIQELEKCVPLCCRCHREVHAGYITL